MKKTIFTALWAMLMIIGIMGGAAPLGAQTIDLDGAITAAAQRIESTLPAGSTIAVLSFASDSEALSRYVVEELTGILVEDGKFTVVDRARLDLLRQEMAFQVSGEVSDDSMQSIGQKLGAQAILSGNFMNIGVGWRFQVFAITVETARRTASYRVTVANDAQVFFLMGKSFQGGGTIPMVPAAPAGSGTPSAAAAERRESPAEYFVTKPYEDGLAVTAYTGNETDVVIPARIGGKQVLCIQGYHDVGPGDGIFSGHAVQSVAIPEGVRIIGESAFAGGYEGNVLRSVVIPSSVTVIGYSAFRGNQLTSVDIPASVSYIDGSAFGYNQLTSVVIPPSVTTIGYGAFSSNRLTRVTIPASVTSIGSAAFGSNTGLTAITVDPGNPAYTSVDGVLFSKDRKRLAAYPAGKGTVYTIPNGVTVIGQEAFSGSQLTSVVIPGSVRVIEDWAFDGNDLTTVLIPAGVTAIGRGAFYRNQLTTVNIPAGITTIGERVFEGNQLRSILIPSNVTAIEWRAFAYNQLKSVVIPKSVTSIGSEAFRGNQLTSVTIPNSAMLGPNAFDDNPIVSITIGAGWDFISNPAYFPNGFAAFYESNGRQAGTYTYSQRNGAWTFAATVGSWGIPEAPAFAVNTTLAVKGQARYRTPSPCSLTWGAWTAPSTVRCSRRPPKKPTRPETSAPPGASCSTTRALTATAGVTLRPRRLKRSFRRNGGLTHIPRWA